MADRTSAALFAEFFELLAEDGPIDKTAFAALLWSKTHEYDFNPYQMYCDEALVKLGLAEKRGDEMLYGPEGDRE